jgi:hypothetical protein
LGAGIGGAAGGWCYGQFGASAVFLMCALMALSWLLLSLSMKQPRYWANLLISLSNLTEQQSDAFAIELLKITGIEEVTLRYEDAVAYLKVDNKILDSELLQSLITKHTQPSSQ